VKIFFETLDEELNKVNRFYRKQESELLERGETLNKHLQILLEINKIFNRCRRKNSSYSSTNSGNSPLWTSSPDRSSNFSGKHFFFKLIITCLSIWLNLFAYNLFTF
jgi:hypothetical protein